MVIGVGENFIDEDYLTCVLAANGVPSEIDRLYWRTDIDEVWIMRIYQCSVNFIPLKKEKDE